LVTPLLQVIPEWFHVSIISTWKSTYGTDRM
jgi:hypothetical protein